MKIFESELKDAVMSVYAGDAFEDFKGFMEEHPYRKIAFIIDENVNRLHKDAIAEGFKGFAVQNPIIIPSGEWNKSLETLERIYGRLCDMEIDRGDLIVAVGGGVVGDIAGFAAGTFKRGMDYVNFPTTLLAQVDSSVGGKTAVNLQAGKNLVGMFHHPKAVFADKMFLSTLERDVLNDGMAELVKYGCIGDAGFFEFLRENGNKEFLDKSASYCVEKALETKMNYVSCDEKDKGGRMLLNFGHTFAHVLETGGGYGSMSHGRAVACGMLQITRLSENKGLTEKGTAGKIEETLKNIGFDTDSFEGFDFDKDKIDIMKQDKKASNGYLNLVLLKRIGEAYIHRVPVGELKEFLK